MVKVNERRNFFHPAIHALIAGKEKQDGIASWRTKKEEITYKKVKEEYQRTSCYIIIFIKKIHRTL